ncbi:MAG: 6,7-dimethyl-8-ribityllumazine synthase [Actinobacteria bacterium]|nr:6,7-dimethyl-8-ribityllumazine synthase [Actinomycetota bacterium]
MIRQVEGDTRGSEIHLGIAVASWNRTITDRLLEGALEACTELGVEEVTVARVPGALELPVTALTLARAGCNAVVAIGTVIKGDTDHYEVVVRESSSGLGRVAIETGVPVANAILAVHDVAHAVERSGSGSANKGREAVAAAVATANTLAGLAG